LNKEIESFIEKANHVSSDIVKLGKEVLNKQRAQSVEEAYETASKAMVTNVTEKPDCREGLAAFAEKRKPHYKH
jgi:enoyl-CoA hydratase/carnithine racemase